MKVLIFAHYHHEGLLRKDTQLFLEKANPGFDKILFISTNLLPSQIAKFPNNIEVQVRDNVGYDFYSFRQGILHLIDLGIYTQLTFLTFMNSSFVCFDPKQLIANYFDLVHTSKKFKVIGLTKTTLIKPHIQSYLITVHHKLLQKSFFIRWWKELSPISDRAQVIHQQEIGFSQFLVKHRIRLKAMFDISKRQKLIDATVAGPNKLLKILKIKNYRKVRNPIHKYFFNIYLKFGIVKIEILKTNPFNVDLSPLMEQIEMSPQFTAFYEESLKN